MIPRNAEVIEHRTVRPRIDIGGVPKSEVTKEYERQKIILGMYGMIPSEPEPYLSDKVEQNRIWKLVEQFSVPVVDISEENS